MKPLHTPNTLLLAVTFLAAGCASPGSSHPSPERDLAPLRSTLRRGVAWLADRQAADGSWGSGVDTARAARALRMSDAPAAAERGTVRVRANCARRPPETAEEAAWALDLDAGLSSARETLVRCQVTKDGDPADGGFSAAPPGAPDLRTTSQAARALGAFPGAPRAIAFVTRCQRPTGGFAGNPGVAHPDPASTCDALIALRGFGVPADDERVKNALLWLRANAPPGFSFRFLASLAAVWQDLGGPPGWRETLSARLLSRQRADGSWVNDGEEMDPVVATALALEALSCCR